MKTYQFKTTATMKEYNYKKWWIDRDIIREITIQADTIRAALDEYRTIVNDRFGVEISTNAIKNAHPMYRDLENGDAVQMGYVITGKTDFDDNHRRWVTQYIDLWVTIYEIKNAFGEEI